MVPTRLTALRDGPHVRAGVTYANAQYRRWASSPAVLPKAWTLFALIELFTLSVLYLKFTGTPIPAPENDEIGPWNVTAVLDPTKVALLLETRPTTLLVPLILHFIAVTPPEWTFRFMGSDGSVAFMRSVPSLRRLIDAGKILTTYLPSNVTTHNQETLSAFLTDIWTYETLLAPAEHLLVFQTDSILCANSAASLNDFTRYAWIGAPWAHLEWGGNGGLSLRRVSSIIEVLRAEVREPGTRQMEDLWLIEKMLDHHIKDVAPRNVSRTFSSELLYSYHPLGYHTGAGGGYQPGAVWGNPELRKELYQWCPEVKMTVDMDEAGFIPGNCSATWKRDLDGGSRREEEWRREADMYRRQDERWRAAQVQLHAGEEEQVKVVPGSPVETAAVLE